MLYIRPFTGLSAPYWYKMRPPGNKRAGYGVYCCGSNRTYHKWIGTGLAVPCNKCAWHGVCRGKDLTLGKQFIY